MIRVAYFPDSFHEVNGVAHTSRQFEDFARRHDLPFLCVRAGDRDQPLRTQGNLTTLELPRSILSIPLEKDLRFDPIWIRHVPAISCAVRSFRPDIVHITGPSELGMLGALLALLHRIPLAASWHTNLHEYAATRSGWLLNSLPRPVSAASARGIELLTFSIVAFLYRWARVLFAPNPDLCNLLESTTGRPCYLMRRGVDTQLFTPQRRDRPLPDSEMVLGFVGRLSVEKNIALLVDVQRQLEASGLCNFHFRIVGHGNEEKWLRERLPRAEFTGILRGEALARAYAGMDIFVFPSHTDTFGNVVLEALASGVPAVVTPEGGPRSLITHGRTGFVAEDCEFPAAIMKIFADPVMHAGMRSSAREYACLASWDTVFEQVYAAYDTVVSSPTAPSRARQK